MATAPLNLEADVVELTREICDIESVSGNEKQLADAIEAALKQYAHLEVIRDGDAIVARTNLGRAKRVVIAGHIDTVPVANNLPIQMLSMEREQVLWGRGTVDMKAGVAVQLRCVGDQVRAGLDEHRAQRLTEFGDGSKNSVRLSTDNLVHASLHELYPFSFVAECNARLLAEVGFFL